MLKNSTFREMGVGGGQIGGMGARERENGNSESWDRVWYLPFGDSEERNTNEGTSSKLQKKRV